MRAIAWKARQRLRKQMVRLRGRELSGPRAVTAIARELVGFGWAIAHEEVLLAS